MKIWIIKSIYPIRDRALYAILERKNLARFSSWGFFSRTYIDGFPDPIPVTFVADGQPTSLRPYPFKGHFEKKVLLPLVNGANFVVVRATNVIGNRGANSVIIHADVEYSLDYEGDELVVTMGQASPGFVIEQGQGTEAGLVNSIRVYVNDAAVTPDNVGQAKGQFFDKEFGLRICEDQIQFDRPFMVVAKSITVAGIPNLINVVELPSATRAQYKGYSEDLRWGYTARNPATQFKYASGTQVEHWIILDDETLTRDNVRVFITHESGFPDSTVDVISHDVKNVFYKDKWRRALWMIIDLKKNAHVINPEKTIVALVQEQRFLFFKKNFRAVPLKVVICAVDGGGYDAIRRALSPDESQAFPAVNFSEVFANAFNLEHAALAHLPSVTWCNWSSVFSGDDPKGHGNPGNAFFGREWTGGIPTPFASAGKKMPDGLDSLSVVVSNALNSQANFTAGSLYDRLDAVVTEPLRCVSVNTLYSKATEGQGLKVERLAHPLYPFRRKSTYFSFLSPLVGTAGLIHRELSISGHGAQQADKLDNISADDVGRVWDTSASNIPDVTSIYFPGPDNYAHAYFNQPGGQVELGGAPAPGIYKHFVEKTDKHFGTFLKKLKEDGYLHATVFALTADHGLIGASTNVNKEVTIAEMEPFFNQGLSMTLWRGSSETPVHTARAVYSPSGGMAHIYVRNSSTTTWSEAGEPAVIQQVAEALCREAMGIASPQRVPDLKDATGRNVGQNGKNIAAVLVRLDGFESNYEWGTITADGIFRTKPLIHESNDDLLHGLQIQEPNSLWPEFATRINAQLKSIRSGDIVVVMNVEAGNQTWPGHDAPEPGSHGGPTRAESQVPLIFNFLGHNAEFVRNAVNAVLPPSAQRPSELRNHHLTPVIEEIVRRVRE